MRTTLDIDDDILQAARERARSEKKTAGQIISELARLGLMGPADDEPRGDGPGGTILKHGWYVFPRRGDTIITKEDVDRLIEEADLEDAGLKPKP